MTKEDVTSFLIGGVTGAMCGGTVAMLLLGMPAAPSLNLTYEINPPAAAQPAAQAHQREARVYVCDAGMGCTPTPGAITILPNPLPLPKVGPRREIPDEPTEPRGPDPSEAPPAGRVCTLNEDLTVTPKECGEPPAELLEWMRQHQAPAAPAGTTPV